MLGRQTAGYRLRHYPDNLRKEKIMEETWYCLYHCYVLTIAHGTQDEMEAERDRLLALEKTEAGKDGRGIKFYCLIKKDSFISFLSGLMP